MMPFCGWIIYSAPYIGGVQGLATGLLFSVLFVMGILILYMSRELLKSPMLLCIEANGIILRHFGFIPWNNFEKIGYDKMGLAFQFRIGEHTDLMPVRCWVPNFKTIQYRDSRVLAFFRTEELGLKVESKDADWRDLLLNLECFYGIWLDPSLKEEKDGVPQLDGKRLTEVLETKKGAIKFGEKYKDMLISFKASP